MVNKAAELTLADSIKSFFAGNIAKLSWIWNSYAIGILPVTASAMTQNLCMTWMSQSSINGYNPAR